MSDYSMNPEGEKFQLPGQEEYAKELKRVESLAEAARKEGKEIVVVMGVGFVGAVMAAIIADTVDKKTGKSSKFVAINSSPLLAGPRFSCGVVFTATKRNG